MPAVEWPGQKRLSLRFFRKSHSSRWISKNNYDISRAKSRSMVRPSMIVSRHEVGHFGTATCAQRRFLCSFQALTPKNPHKNAAGTLTFPQNAGINSDHRRKFCSISERFHGFRHDQDTTRLRHLAEKIETNNKTAVPHSSSTLPTSLSKRPRERHLRDPWAWAVWLKGASQSPHGDAILRPVNPSRSRPRRGLNSASPRPPRTLSPPRSSIRFFFALKARAEKPAFGVFAAETLLLNSPLIALHPQPIADFAEPKSLDDYRYYGNFCSIQK